MNRLIVCALLIVISDYVYPETLNLLWKNTDAAKYRQWGESNYPSWQGFGMGGKYYIQNATKEVIEVWDASGKIDEIPSGKGTNINKDSEGNIIVRYGSYLKPLLLQNQILVIDPVSGQRKIISDAPLNGDKCYLFGNVTGNIFGELGTLYCMAQGDTRINCIPISYANYLWGNTGEYDFGSIIHKDIDILQHRGLKRVNNNALVMAHTAKNNETELSISNPYYNLTGSSAGNANSIYKAVIKDNKLQRIGFYRTPYHNGCAGFDILHTNDSISYIIYPSGDNNTDGFTISKIEDIAQSPANNSQDNKYIILSKEEDSNIPNNELYINNLNFELTNDNSIYIYQYVPGAYVAMYELVSDDDSVTETISDNPFTIQNDIIYFSRNEYHYIYNIAGMCIVSGCSLYEQLPKGIYFVKVFNSIHKIIIN